MSNETPRPDLLEKRVYGNEIQTTQVQAPFTTIKNEQGQPRQIPDLANNMKVSMGIERVMFNSISKLNKEFGPNGEVVSEIADKDKRIRFVGTWRDISSANGGYISTDTTNDYVEVSFYGTGLNALIYISVTARDYRVSIDGGPEGSNVYPASPSGILIGRNYRMNSVISLASGLSEGWHTAKIRINGIEGLFFGIEILNESSQLVINPGKPSIDGVNREIQTQVLSNYNSDFDVASDPIGTKGGRVKVYQDANGDIKKRFKAVDITPQFLGLTNHQNEEVYRIIPFREFGANRGDDFSTLGAGASTRAFTLDDGTTTLVGNQVKTNADGSLEFSNVIGAFITLTFTGTGLDLISKDLNGSGTETADFEIFVDGVSVGLLDDSRVQNRIRTLKICSGLPYGTHVVKINLSTNLTVGSFGMNEFIVYQPKEPTLSTQDIELFEYNIMADFVANTIASSINVSTGILRKVNTREMIYKGGVSIGIDSGTVTGIFTNINDAAGYGEYTFFGTGVDFRFFSGTATPSTTQVLLDGVITDFTPYTTSNYGNGANTWTPGTGILTTNTPTNTYGSGLVISGLPLGKHTIRFTNNSGTLRYSALDIITPIHMNNTKVGSLSGLDLRTSSDVVEQFKNKIDLSKAKAWIVYSQNTSQIRGSYNVSSVLEQSAGVFYIYWKQPFKDNTYAVTLSTSERSARIHSTVYTGSALKPNYVRVETVNNADASVDADYVAIVAYGELENEEDLDLENL